MVDKEDPVADKSEDQLREELYQTTRTELLAQRFSNSEAYDKAVLTLSSAFLGVSLAFIKDAAQGNLLACPWLLVVSWGAFASAIVATVVSFQIGNQAIEIQLDRAEKYYKQKDDTAHPKSWSARFVDYVNWASGSLFIIGVVLTIVFVSINLVENPSVSKISKTGPTHANDAQPIGTLQKAHPITSMPKVSPSPAPVTQPAPAAPPPAKSK